MILAATGNNYWMMVAAIVVENVTSGIGLTVFTTYLSGLSSVAYTATQFALLSSFAGVGRTFMAGPAGIIAEEAGWVGFWGISVLAAIPGMLLLWILWSRGYVVEGIRQTDASRDVLKEPIDGRKILGFVLLIIGGVSLILSQQFEYGWTEYAATIITIILGIVLVRQRREQGVKPITPATPD